VRPAIVLILGYPGTGKLTVSKELISTMAADLTPIRLIDNHATANILFDLIAEADGQSVLPPEVLDSVREINLIVARTIDHLSPLDWSFVLTHHLQNNDRNHSYIGRLKSIAEHRGSTFLSVILTCKQDVLLRRVAHTERRSRNKLIEPSIAKSIIEGGMLIPDDSITIDITSRTPADTSGVIRDELVRRS
jgi:tRNA uridine 5-carbamoylmethylation protein Kti12